MLKLNDKYILKWDDMNWVLVKVSNNKKGGKTEKLIGYFGRFDALVSGLQRERQKTLNKSIDKLDDYLKYSVDILDDIKCEFSEAFEELKQENLGLRARIKELEG